MINNKVRQYHIHVHFYRVSVKLANWEDESDSPLADTTPYIYPLANVQQALAKYIIYKSTHTHT